MDLAALREAIVDLLHRYHSRPESLTETRLEAIRAEIDAALALLPPPDASDEAESVSRADIYRIRLGKLVARLLPPDVYRDFPLRARIWRELRDLVGLLFGEPLARSVYLDGRREE